VGTAGVLLILTAACFHLNLSLCHSSSLQCSTTEFHSLFLALFPSDRMKEVTSFDETMYGF
jgi:hypothetical protein